MVQIILELFPQVLVKLELCLVLYIVEGKEKHPDQDSTYEAVGSLTKIGLGQSPTCIGMGGDPIIGTSICDAVKMFMNDENTFAIVMIEKLVGENGSRCI